MASESKAGKGGAGGWIFLAVVLVTYGVTALLDSELTLRAITVFLQLLDKVYPVLVLVFLLIFIIDLLLNPKRVEKYLGSKSGIMGWLTAIVTGILSTGPVYAWYAVLHDLRNKGMRTSLISVVLYTRAIKLPLLPLLIHYFGLAYTVILAFYLIGFSIIGGIILEKVLSAPVLQD
ncbi:MAG: permease [Pseudomonadota bacterium]|nr:permease [Pseudomonadota bacterium]